MCFNYINSIFIGLLWFCNDHGGKTSVIQKDIDQNRNIGLVCSVMKGFRDHR